MTVDVLPPKDAFTRIASSLCVPDPVRTRSEPWPSSAR